MEIYHRRINLFSAIDALETTPNLLIRYLNHKEVHKFAYFKEHEMLFKNIKQFETKDHYYIFEMMRDGRKRKPYLDVEFYYPNEKEYKKDMKRVLNLIIDDTIKIFKSQYGEVLKRTDIKLLNSSGQSGEKYKMSYHLTISPENRTLCYTSGKQTTSSAYHYYTLLLAKNESHKEWLDSLVYGSEATMRIIGSAKSHTDLRLLTPVDVNTFKEIKVSSKQKLDYMLSHIKSEHKMLSTPTFEQTVKPPQNLSFNNPTMTVVTDSILKMVQKSHPSAKYGGLYKDLFYRFSYTDRNEICPISGEVHTGTNSCYVTENARGYYLKCFSSKCEGSVHIGYADMSNEVVRNGVQLDRKYMIMKDTFEDDTMGKHIMRWMELPIYKLLAVKSAMGTGKTTMIEKIFDRYQHLKKILWITHRQTLTRQIFGKFKKYGFSNYIDEDGSLFHCHKIVVQIDSLFRITKYDENRQLNINAYDLVIIDEIEGNLNHYSSPFLKKNGETDRSTFDFMLSCMRNAKKVLLLDADIGSRTAALIAHVGEYLVVNNKYKPVQKSFVVTNDAGKFDKLILSDIKDGKNVCVVSMTAQHVDKLASELENMDIKYVSHTSRTDDQLKLSLENANEFWKDYQVVLYSPCIESGVDFNLEHFDKVYGVMKNGDKTCSQRAFLQMIGRIRTLKDYTITCLYTGPSNIDSPMYTFDDLLGYLKYYETINNKKIIKDIEFEEVHDDSVIKLVRKPGNISLFDEISIHNEVERLNKMSSTFMSVMNKLLQIGGHNLEFNITANPSSSKIGKERVSTKDQIINIDEREYNIDQLILAQNKCELNETQKLALQKKFMIMYFGIKNTDDRELLNCFLDEFSSQEITCRRFEDFFRYKKVSDDDEYDNLSTASKKMRNDIVVDLLEFLTGKKKKIYTPDYLNIEISGPDYDKRLTDIVKKSMYFTKEDESRPLFFQPKSKNKQFSEENKQHYTNTIQSILRVYGIIFKATKRVRYQGKLGYQYLLSVDEQIRNIVNLKYGLPSDAKEYEPLFVEPAGEGDAQKSDETYDFLSDEEC